MNKSLLSMTSRLLAELDHLNVKLWLDGDDLKCVANNNQLTPELLQQLKQHKTELIANLQDLDIRSQRDTQNTKNNARLPLSFAQQRLWFLEQLPHEVGVYLIPFAIKITGDLDLPALEAAINQVAQRHEVLRTTYPAINGEPYQSIQDAANIQINSIHLGDTLIGATITQEQINQLLVKSAQRPLNPSKDLPIRVEHLQLNNTESILCLNLHHIACDGWSLDIFMSDLGACYRAILIGQEPNLAALSVQYADFSLWQRKRLSGEFLQQQQNYWQGQLGNNLPVLDLPTDFPRPKIQGHNGAFVQFHLPESLVEHLRKLGQKHSASLFMTLLAAYNTLLSRYSNQNDIVVGVPVANRQSKDLEGVIGLFVNTLVLRSQLHSKIGFTELLSQVRQTTLDALSHQDLPFEQLIEVLQPERDMSRNPLFQAKFRLENATPKYSELPGISLQKLPQSIIKAKLDLSMDLYESADGITGGLEYNTSLFASKSMQHMANHFVTLLQSIVDNPECPIADLDLLSPEQIHTFNKWNETTLPFKKDTCFHYLFEEMVEIYGSEVALIFDSCTEKGSETLSYEQLNGRANQLAHWLRANGAGPEVVVGICLDRSTDMITAMLAVLKSGAAYLPLDANYPVDRLTFMLQDAQVPILLSHSNIDLPQNITRLNLDKNWPSEQPYLNPSRSSQPNHLAYIIYTSGSTGQPKGVMIEHQGLVNLTEDKIRVCQIHPRDCVLQFFSFSFDASIPEIIMSLAAGAQLLLAPASKVLPGPELSQLMIRNNVSHITMTPSALAGLPYHTYPDLRMVLVGGEPPTVDLIEKWSKGRLFINAYGPTETTVNASMVVCGNGHPLEATLLPSTNKQLHILDKNMQRLPIGAIGELHIGGIGLARGYLNRPELTSQKFVKNPFYSTHNKADNFLYKTGDLGFHLSDGRIRLVGRIDHQVKIRGFRVELGELEHAITGHPAVKSAVVIAINDVQQEGKKLAAFAIAAKPDSSETPSDRDMRTILSEQLPSYMTPSCFHWIESLPLTINGKVDNKVLEQLASAISDTAVVVPPRNQTESLVVDLFSDILDLNQISIETDFFDAGGHSLLATKLVSQLLDAQNIEITVMDLFEAPTVAALAQRIEHKLKLARLQGTTIDSCEEREEIEF